MRDKLITWLTSEEGLFCTFSTLLFVAMIVFCAD